MFKLITSFKINKRGTPLLTNLLLGSSMFHEKRADVAGSVVLVSSPATFDGFSQVYPPPLMHFEISTDISTDLDLTDHKFG